jgi:hypothetical protein
VSTPAGSGGGAISLSYAQLREFIQAMENHLLRKGESAAVPLTVTCNNCGTSGETTDASAPHAAVQCACCPQDHDHSGLGCRTVTITATADLTGTAG